MTKDVNLNSDTWTKMTGALTAIMESATETYSSASVSSAYQGSYSSGKAGFAKRIDDLVKISEKAKNLITEKDTDGVVSFSYHDDRESATTLQVSLGKLERYSSHVSRYVKEKIDQPFYEAMDKVGARLEALSIRSYTTTNTVGFKKTEVVVDTTGSRFETREVSPQTIGLSDLYQVESPYKTALARSYEQFKASETYKEHKLSQDDYLMAMHHTRAFVYKSIDDQKESLEFWRDLTLSTGVVILTIFCPPAGAAAGFVLAGAEMYSATTGKDWGTGRELDTTERGLRAGFALFDLIPGVGYVNDLAKSGSKVAAKEFIQTSIQKGMAQGAKNLDSFKQVLKQVKGFGDTILTNMDTYAKQLDTLVKSKVSTLADNLADKLHHADEAISEAARNFRLNVGLEPQLVGGLMPSSSPGRLSDLADNLQAFAKSLDGSVDEVEDILDNIPISERISGISQNVIIKESVSSEEVNSWWKTQGYVEPPYTHGTSVQVIELLDETKFVRVYDGENSGLYGGWLMKAEDIRGLTPIQIQEKFALPHTPKYVGEVTLQKGSLLRMGEVNPLFGFKGGGVQFDLMGQYIGEFKELGNIVN